MIAAGLVLVAALLLAAGYLASIPALGWAAIAVAAAAGVLVLRPSLRTDSAAREAPGQEARGQEARGQEALGQEALAEEEPAEETLTEEAPAEESPTRAAPDELVLVSPGRRRFHRPGCDLLADLDREELTVGEARDEGFSACTRCAS